MPSRPEPLAQLAAAVGVATTYDDYLRRPVQVSDAAVRRALAAMGIEAGDDDLARTALERLQRERDARRLPACLVVRPGDTPWVPAPADGAPVTLVTEDGATATLAATGDRVLLPADLPLGYHRLEVEQDTAHVIASPGVCPDPLTTPGYAWMAQLYATRSERSWGMGDLADLADLASFGGQLGAAGILVNPLHAAAPVLPQQPSPYSPTSRRYRNPLYLRIEDVDELTGLSSPAAAEVSALATTARASSTELIDRDTIFESKMRALALLRAVAPTPERAAAFRRWCAAEGAGLEDFATFCVLAEQHGVPWQTWPADLRHPAAPGVVAFRSAHRDRVEFHMWLQWLCDMQLARAQSEAVDAGMSVGIVHDLAVGVDPGGADAWALQDDLAAGATVGAPPDGFNQRGQDWGLPPLLPDRLRYSGYQPFKDMLRSVLRHAGGIRIDHVMGLWRLWWVPPNGSPAEGTYVTYPASDLLGVLSLEAHRAGALVVGEDLGTVQAGVREAMAEHRILSSRVLYFERVDDDPQQPMLPAKEYPQRAFVSISTHDLPTAAGWWADEEITVQAELGLFGDATTPGAEQQRKAGEREDMVALLQAEELVGPDASDEELAIAMHAFLARTPALLVAASLGDALGDRRQPNMPGTVDEYPNWRLPLATLADGQPRAVTLDELFTDPRMRTIAALLAGRGARRA